MQKRSSGTIVTAEVPDDGYKATTSREQEVLALMAAGQSNAGIAKTLWITQSAVEKHINRIFSKLGVTATLDTH
jgi:DNA-binding NarL/FixJ family response regulator